MNRSLTLVLGLALALVALPASAQRPDWTTLLERHRKRQLGVG